MVGNYKGIIRELLSKGLLEGCDMGYINNFLNIGESKFLTLPISNGLVDYMWCLSDLIIYRGYSKDRCVKVFYNYYKNKGLS